MKNYKLLLLMMISFLCLQMPLKTWALTAEICLDGSSAQSMTLEQRWSYEGLAFAALDGTTPSMCHQLKPVQTGLSVLSITLGVGAIAAECGVITAPIGVAIGVASITTGMLSGTISLVCDEDPVTEDRVQELICQKFAEKGIPCDDQTRMKLK